MKQKKNKIQAILSEIKFLGPLGPQGGSLRYEIGKEGVVSIEFAAGLYTIIKEVKASKGVQREKITYANIPSIQTVIEVELTKNVSKANVDV